MKGFVGAIFLGVCLVIMAAVLIGALTFPDAMAIIMGMLWLIVWAIVIIIIIVVVIIILAAIFG